MRRDRFGSCPEMSGVRYNDALEPVICNGHGTIPDKFSISDPRFPTARHPCTLPTSASSGAEPLRPNHLSTRRRREVELSPGALGVDFGVQEIEAIAIALGVE